MKKPLRARYWLLASIVVIGLIVLRPPDRSPLTGKDWLTASTPTFGSRINTDGICDTVSFTVSNVGPRKLDFGIAWYECRAKRNLSVLATSLQTHTNGGGYVYGMFGDGPPTPLSPGATCIVTRDLSPNASTNEARLFCCEIGWIGHEPKVSGQRFDDFMVWALNIFNIDWKRRWPVKPSMIGAVFTSNIEAADYFRFVYGVEGNNGTFPIPSSTAYVEIAAEMAFTSFCRQSTNARN